MKEVLKDFNRTIEEASERLFSMTEVETLARRGDEKWSAKEILGHLIDSASNNHQRFVRAQFTEGLVFPGYEQELWVRTQRYADEPWPLLVNLWKYYNLHLAHVMEHVPEAVRRASRDEHNLHQIGWVTIGESEPATLEYLMLDYVGHLKHHLRQIFDE
jgi:hypothetical protein